MSKNKKDKKKNPLLKSGVPDNGIKGQGGFPSHIKLKKVNGKIVVINSETL